MHLLRPLAGLVSHSSKVNRHLLSIQHVHDSMRIIMRSQHYHFSTYFFATWPQYQFNQYHLNCKYCNTYKQYNFHRNKSERCKPTENVCCRNHASHEASIVFVLLSQSCRKFKICNGHNTP